jgi:hypothetical protein
MYKRYSASSDDQTLRIQIRSLRQQAAILSWNIEFHVKKLVQVLCNDGCGSRYW